MAPEFICFCSMITVSFFLLREILVANLRSSPSMMTTTRVKAMWPISYIIVASDGR